MLCRAGKLYEVERWISSGKSLNVSPQTKKIPIQVAIELAFHSLIELLIRNEHSQANKDRGLADAVDKRRLDYVELLVTHGANPRSVPFVDVLLTWEPSIIKFFLDNAADVLTDAPFAVAFREKIRTALRPFVEYKKTHPELASALQEQADRALRHFCYEGDLKWVSLLLWAGANPRSRGPTLDDRWADDPDCHTTAFHEACSKGSLEILKKLKPDPARDDLSGLFASASNSRELINYLLAFGANPNDKPNGGSSALDRLFWHLGFARFDIYAKNRIATRFDVRDTFECIRELVEHGALWRPDDRRELNWVRQMLYKCEPQVSVDLVKLLARNKASNEETLEQLLNAPRMRQHLSTLGMNMTAPAAARARTNAARA